MFFVVEIGNAEMVKLLAGYTDDVECIYHEVPLLGYAIALCQSFRKNMPMVVKTLLSLGASIATIPRSFYFPLHGDIPDDGPELPNHQAHSLNKWYASAPKQVFARALNFSFTVRYSLHRASQHLPLSGSYKKLAEVHKASGLLGMRYFLVGQTLAAERLTESLLT